MQILLADDHALFRSGIRLVLAELDPSMVVTEAGTHDEAIAALRAQKVDLILTDLVMPGMRQDTGIAEYKSLCPDVPIIVVSMLDSASDIRRAVDAGATGFIPKSSTPKIMMEAIKLVLAGGIYLPPSVLVAEQAGEPASEPKATPPVRQLTERQRDVLGELALGKSNKEIAQSLNLSEATVKVHVAAIMRVLDVRNRTQAVMAAAQFGLLPPT